MSEDLSLLRPREREIYTRKQRGLSNSQIAAEMGITDDNVRAVISIARRRLAGLVPAFGARPVGRPAKSDQQREQEALMRMLNEPRCTRCRIRGHVVGDPDRCLSVANYATRQGTGGGKLSSYLTGEQKNPARSAP